MVKKRGQGTKSRQEKQRYVRNVSNCPSQSTTACALSVDDFSEPTIEEQPDIYSSVDPRCDLTENIRPAVRPVPFSLKAKRWAQDNIVSVVVVPVCLAIGGLVFGYVTQQYSFSVVVRKDISSLEKNITEIKDDIKSNKKDFDATTSQVWQKIYEIIPRVNNNTEKLAILEASTKK